MSSQQQSRFDLPGFTLPLDYRPSGNGWLDRNNAWFPHALDRENQYYGSSEVPGHVATHREILMLRIMNTITDKPEWQRKVFDEEIIKKWKQEISQSGEDVTERMMNWIFKELQWKAEILEKENLVSVFDIGVVKSDTAVPEQLKQLLKEAVVPFEDVPEEKKDYHPGSDGKVVDLVHPSLFPVVYGRTHVLRDRVIGLDDCLKRTGEGEQLPTPPKQNEGRTLIRANHEPYSQKFQWLPCDVEFTDNDDETGCRITSYINNVHPMKHRELYGVVEKVIARAIPLWNKSLTLPKFEHGERIEYSEVEYLDHVPEPIQQDGEDDEDYYQRYDAWQETQPIQLPEPSEEFKPPNCHEPEECVDLRKKFKKDGLQVIVKLANIELTPEKPEYEGGSWHIEGQLNERICATAIYYYDSENITESRLSFRQRPHEQVFDELSYEQSRHEFLQQVYGFPGQGTFIPEGITQDLGGVVCREGRLLTFPNIVQHRVSPFSLEDKSKPGHRKILALFLVDPHLRIISSANVPPQQWEWSRGKMDLVDRVLSRRLPPELQDMVRRDVPRPFMTMLEAKGYRLELMEERGAKSELANEMFKEGEFSLCEH